MDDSHSLMTQLSTASDGPEPENDGASDPLKLSNYKLLLLFFAIGNFGLRRIAKRNRHNP